jgi:hypothetical protein
METQQQRFRFKKFKKRKNKGGETTYLNVFTSTHDLQWCLRRMLERSCGIWWVCCALKVGCFASS